MKKIKPKIYIRDRKKLEKRRIAAGKLFDKGVSQVKISIKYNVTKAAVSQWHTAWKKNKKKGLLSKGTPGFASVFTKEKKNKLKKLIQDGPVSLGYDTDYWTIACIQDVAKKKLRITLGYTSIWTTVKGLRLSCQKPERRARERDEKAIDIWKHTTFPDLKKNGPRNIDII
jgi:transposase